MRVRHLFAFVLLLVPVARAAAAADPAPPPAPPKPPELKVLDQYVGNWDGQYTIKASAWAPEERNGVSADVTKWALEGRFLETRGANKADGSESAHITTFDAAENVYRHWYFNSRGNFAQYIGRWDEAAKSMTWAGDLPGGAKAALVDHWKDDDHREWSMVIKDADGKVVFEMSATATRRK